MPNPDQLMVSIASGSEAELKELRHILKDSGAQVGDITTLTQPSDLNFAPAVLLPIAHKLLVVLATEAAKKLVEWCYKKVTEKKVGDPPLAIRVSGQVVVIVNGADPRTIESQLQSLLRMGA